jgi:hypothetical protein
MTETLQRLRHDPATRSRQARKALVLGAGILGGVAARRALAAAWSRSRATGRPPLTPDEPGITWPRALAWAVLSGVATGLARLAARRLSSAAAPAT